MNLNTRQKTGMLVAAIAVGALGLDRFAFGGGPATASAQSAEPLAVETAYTPAARTESQVTFAQRLERFAQRESVNPNEGVPDGFGETGWVVSSVIGSGEKGAVRIGKHLIRVGGTYEDGTLLRVDRDGAVFLRAGREYRAPLERALAADAR